MTNKEWEEHWAWFAKGYADVREDNETIGGPLHVRESYLRGRDVANAGRKGAS